MPPTSTAGHGLAVHPFRALTYAAADREHLARVTSPAYDLVTASGRDRLAAADPHNVVRLILPGTENPSDGDCDSPAAGRAAAVLARWTAEGVLVLDEQPALWCYRMRSPSGVDTVGWLAAVELPPAGSPAVLPHEDVYPPAVEGRRLLLATTRTDLEPIVLAHDHSSVVAEATAEVVAGIDGGAADLEVADPDGVVHELRRVTDPRVHERLGLGFSHVAAVIADGHHRFAAARALAAGRPGCVLALLTPMGPGGLRVQAIHRVVPGLDLATARRTAEQGFTVSPVPVPVPDGTDAWSPGPGRFLVTDGREAVLLSAPTDAVRARIPTGAPASWRSLDVVLAHHGLLTGLWGRSDDPASVLIAHDVEESLRLAREHSGVALLLHPSSPSDVAAVARDGARMPRKSTLFVPKPRTGLVFRPL